MAVEQCVWSICFVPLDGSGQKFFGFSEFLAGLALMVLAWTIGDVRYRFRVRTAPIPLLGLTFTMVAVVGLLTLLTDLWRAQQWLVPRGSILSPGGWQAILGGLFLLTFLAWTWFAFIRPTTYGRLNAKRYAQALYRCVLKGSPEELAIIADELAPSVGSLVAHATVRERFRIPQNEPDRVKARKVPQVEAYANDLLLLIADKRLCRAIVKSSPGTALAVFRAMADQKKYGVQVQTFAKNIVNEALADTNSFLFHEAEGFQSGLLGYHKPLSQAMFSNYELVETVGSVFDRNSHFEQWDAVQWKAYCRIVLMTFRSFIERGYGDHSFVLCHAMGTIEHAASDVHTLNELTGVWKTEPFRRLEVVVDFIKSAVEVLNKNGVPDYVIRRSRAEHDLNSTFFDYLANMIFEVLFHVSAVKSPHWECWSIQHNASWGQLFNIHRLDGPAARLVRFKVRRLLYNDICEMRTFANFKGAKILGLCLNVMGLKIKEGKDTGDSRALHKAVLSWTRKNYVWLHQFNPRVAEACLVDQITYDADNRRLVHTYPADGLRREPLHIYLELDPAPADSNPEVGAGG